MVQIGDVYLGEVPVILAPMEDITDPPFRYICKKLGADLMFTEFISSEGLIRDASKSLKKLDVSEEERPVGIQIFGHNTESMVVAARMAEAAGPDIIDINFGCPVKKVVSKGAGAAMMKDPVKMAEICSAVVKTTSLPVTVKTRLGWDESSKNIIDVTMRLQDTGIKALAIHARTRAQQYKGTADWSLIGEVMKLPGLSIPVFGNGDITSGEKAMEVLHKYNVDGLMIGRAAIGNPWIFSELKTHLRGEKSFSPPSLKEKIEICRLHIAKSIEWKGEKRALFEMRKHYAHYFKGLNDFKPFKIRLMEIVEADILFGLLDEIESAYH